MNKPLTGAEVNQLIAGLNKLSHNLWWSWNQEAQDIFQELTPRGWQNLFHNAVAVLREVSEYELRVHLQDLEFAGRVRTVLADFEKYLTDQKTWGHLHAPEWGAALEATSFPSFHYTLYASVARVYAKMYHNNWLPYGIAALLMGSDFKGHHHWVSDAVVGSIVGTEIGNVVVDNYQGVTPAHRPVTLVPAACDPNGIGVALQVAR